MNISLRQIRAFASVAKHLSVTQAAHELHLTQSAVSMLVQQLEEQLGVVVFLRHKGRMTLTEHGKELLPHAHQMLSDLEHMTRCAHDLRRARQEVLRIAVPQLLACTGMSRVLDAFGHEHPDVALTVVDGSADEVSDVVRRGDANIGIGPQRRPHDEVQRIFLAEVPMVLVFAAHHPLAQRRQVAWSALGQENWIVYSSEFNHDLQKIFTRHHISLNARTVTQVNHLTTALALAGQGIGVTAVPHYATQLAGSFGLKYLPVQAPVLLRDFFIYHRKGTLLSAAAQQLCALVQTQLQATQSPTAAPLRAELSTLAAA